MINLSTSHITVMSDNKVNNTENKSSGIFVSQKDSSKQVLGKPFLKAVNDFTQEGERQTWCICKIDITEQNTLDKKAGTWSPKTKTVTKFNPKTGKETTEVTSVKGYVLELFKKDDPECVVRRLAINADAGVKYMDKFVSERAQPITKYIQDEELVLEKVDNGAGYYPSILPIGA